MAAPNPYTSGKGDVLDQALHVARTQAAGKGATGFFNALKPNDTTDFQSTSRINVARPAAQATRNAKVVPAPKRQAQAPAPTKKLSSAQLMQAAGFHPSSIDGLAKDAAGAAESGAKTAIHHPLQAALAINPVTQIGEAALGNPLSAKLLGAANKGVNKGLAKLAAPQSGAGLQGAASTNAGILGAAGDVPFASLSPAFQKQVRSAASFFAQHPSYHYNVPDIGIYNQKDKTGLGLAPTATDADVVRAYGDELAHFGHRDYVEGLLHNVPLNAIQLAAAPLGTAYLASQAAQGNTKALEEAGKEQLAFGKGLVEHPLKTLHDQPVTTLTTALGAARALGGFGGTLARAGVAGDMAKAFATPTERNVVPNLGPNPVTPDDVTLQPHAINRGLTSTKLDERAVQGISDLLAQKTSFFGKRLQQQNADAITRTSVRQRDAAENENVTPAIRAAAKLSPTEERATRFIHGQALGTPKEHAAFIQQQADAHRATAPEPGTEARWQQDQRALDADAKLWTKVAANRKVGDTPTPKQQDYLDKATHASRFGEQDLAAMTRQGTNVPLVSPDVALRSAYAPAAAVRGIDVRDTASMTKLRSDLRAAKNAPPVEPGTPLDEHDPLYNPNLPESPRTMMGLRRGNTLGMMHGNPAVRFGNRRLGTEGEVRTGGMIPKGQASSAPHVYFGAVAKPLRVAAALNHFRDQGATWIRDVPNGTAYDTRNWVRVRDDHTGTPNSDVRTLSDTHEATRTADDAQTLRQQILGGVEDDKGNDHTAYIPPDGTYHLAPRASINNLENRLKSTDVGTLAKIAKTGTGLWRWTTLMARPAWLVNNASGNIVQASIAGAGPGDWVQAFKQGAGGHSVEGVENAGQYKNVMQQKPTLGSRALKPVHAFTNTVVEANVRFENMARRAVANHTLNSLAKAHVHNEIGTIRSSFHHTSEAVRDAMNNPTPEMQARVVKSVDSALGNFISTKHNAGADLLSPFRRWFMFISKYTAELPVKTPGRALVLQRLGQLGINVQNQSFGGMQTNSKIGAVQLPSWVPEFGGEYKSTQGLNPLATALQLADLSDQSSLTPGDIQFGGIAGATNPLLMAALNWATGKDNSWDAADNTIKDKYGNDVGPFAMGNLKDQLLNTLPIASAIQGYAPAAGQPRSGPADRIGGYLFGGVGPYNPLANRDSKIVQLKKDEVAKARNKLAKS